MYKRQLPDSDVCIQTDTHLNTTITCEKAKFTIPGKSGDDFAYLPVIERSEGIEISQFTLKEVIRQTIFSIAANENNKLMTGELFEMKENILKVVSLDGHRIASRKIELKNNYPSRKVVVPGKTLNEISKILSGEVEDQVKIFFTDNHIAVSYTHLIFPGAGQYDCRSGCYRLFSDGGCILYGRQPAESVFHRGTAFRSSEYLHRYPAGTQQQYHLCDRGRDAGL